MTNPVAEQPPKSEYLLEVRDLFLKFGVFLNFFG